MAAYTWKSLRTSRHIFLPNRYCLGYHLLTPVEHHLVSNVRDYFCDRKRVKHQILKDGGIIIFSASAESLGTAHSFAESQISGAVDTERAAPFSVYKERIESYFRL